MFREILSGITASFLKWLLSLIVLGLAGVLSPTVFDWSWAGSFEPVAKTLVQSVGVSLLTASVVMLVLDLGFRKAFINDVESVFTAKQKEVGVGKYVSSRRELDGDIEADIREATPGTTISIAAVSQKGFFTDAPGIELIYEKVRSGVNLQVLVWHPSSGLVKEYENLSRKFGSPSLANSLRLAQGGHIRETYLRLKDSSGSNLGKFEVRLVRDAFSTLYLYVGLKTVVLGTYLSDRRGSLSPAFTVAGFELAKILESHFNTLWDKASESVLYAVADENCIDNYDKFANDNEE